MSHCALKTPAKGLQVEYSHRGHNVLSLHTTELFYVRAAEALSRLLSAGRTRKGMFPIPLLLWNTVTHFPCPSPLPLISDRYDNILHVLHACIWNNEQCRCVWTKVQVVSLCQYRYTYFQQMDCNNAQLSSKLYFIIIYTFVQRNLPSAFNPFLRSSGQAP